MPQTLASSSITTGNASAKSSSTVIIQGNGTVSNSETSATANSGPDGDSSAESSVNIDTDGEVDGDINVTVNGETESKHIDKSGSDSIKKETDGDDAQATSSVTVSTDDVKEETKGISGSIQNFIEKLRSLLKRLF